MLTSEALFHCVQLRFNHSAKLRVNTLWCAILVIIERYSNDKILAGVHFERCTPAFLLYARKVWKSSYLGAIIILDFCIQLQGGMPDGQAIPK